MNTRAQLNSFQTHDVHAYTDILLLGYIVFSLAPFYRRFKLTLDNFADVYPIHDI